MKLKFLLLLTIFSFVFVTTFAYAEIPQLISLQGKLSSAATHSPLTGTYSMTFKIYNVATGGTAKWTETQSVNTNKGLFNTLLGSGTTLNLPFNESYWLEVQVGTDTLSPRQRMASVPYALTNYTLLGGAGGGGGDRFYFGSGVDGNAVITTNTNLDTVKNFNSLTINSGATLSTSSPVLLIYVNDTLTVNAGGTISMNGRGGGGGAGGAGSGCCPSASSGSPGIQGAVSAGGTGGSGGSLSGALPAGGGGSGGVGEPYLGAELLIAALPGKISGTFFAGSGGGGGGSGGTAGGPSWQSGGPGGAGGAGGGTTIIFARNIVHNGVMSANGLNGAAGSAASCCGGGGGGAGGGGGVIYTVYTSLSGSGSFTISGGTGGAGGAGYANGASGGGGATGKVFKIEIPTVGAVGGAAAGTTTLGMFGDGSDGDATIASSTSLSGDMYYGNLIVSSGVTLNPNGYRIFVKGTLTNNGLIDRSGSPATGTLGGGSAGGTSSSGCVGVKGGDGGAGGGVMLIAATSIVNNGQINAKGGNGGAGSAVMQVCQGSGSAGSSVVSSLGGAGGSGGSAPGACGAFPGGGGSVSSSATYPKTIISASLMLDTGNPTNIQRISGGSGGGGGGVYTGQCDDGGGAGGGGGGGGGVIVLMYKTMTGSGTVSVAGGSGGPKTLWTLGGKVGSATDGSPGNPGSIYYLPI